MQPSSTKVSNWQRHEFVPHGLLSNEHLMTIVPGFLPRGLGAFRKAGVARLFHINDETKLLGYMHRHKNSQITETVTASPAVSDLQGQISEEAHQERKQELPTVIIFHGLEGSSESSHCLGIGSKCFALGFDVLRLNMRTCGDSMQHSVSLYHAGLWQDVETTMKILHKEDGIKKFILVGYSLGGNLILNAAANHKDSEGFELTAVCAVSPSVDLAHSVQVMEMSVNQIYQDFFLRSLKKKMLAKSKQHPHVYKIESLKNIQTVREFDNCFTAPHGGYGTAERYYKEASSLPNLHLIKVKTMIITSQDDPLVPVDPFQRLQVSCPQIELLITAKGGHGGFFQNQREAERNLDQYWAENRVVQYIREVSRKPE